MQNDASSTIRFSDRVADYVRYRPGYPDEVRVLLHDELELGTSSVVADIGSGTGISTELFLTLGCQTNAVEPNDAMRSAAERRFGNHPLFVSLRGTAEDTTLADMSQDCIASAQAFHWFDVLKTRQEFQRILKPDGIVVLLWNERLTTGTRFLEAYEQLLLDFATDYVQVNHAQITVDDIQSFFGREVRTWEYPNSQRFDFDGLRGRLLSSSYVSKTSDNSHAMLDRLRQIFDQNQVDGRISFDYVTKIYVGSFSKNL